MKFKTTLWFLLLALLLGVGFYYAQKNVPSSDTAADKAKLLLRIKPADVVEVEIKAVDHDFVFEKKGLKWFVRKPIEARANGSEIDGFLASVEYLERRRVITPADLAENKLTLADFDLEKPKLQLDLKTASGVISFKVGKKPKQGDDLYVQIAGDPNIYRVEGDIGDRISKKLADYRERALFEFAPNDVRRIEIHNGPKLVEFTRTNDQWRITQPLSARADHEKVEEFLSQTCGMRADDFISEDPAASREYGLDEPAQQVVIQLDKPENEPALLIGSKLKTDEQKIAVKVRGQNSIVGVSTNYSVEAARPLNDFRDRKIASFYADEPEEIEIRNRQVVVLLRREGKDWKIVQPESLDADNELVARMVGKLGEIQVKDFTADVVTDLDKYGLKAPAFAYTLRGKAPAQTNATGRVLLNLTLGKEDAAKKLVFARAGDEPAVYGFDSADTADLPKSAMDVRSRMLFSVKKDTLKSCVQKKGKSTVTMERGADGVWKIGEGSVGVLNETDWTRFQNMMEHFTVEKIVGTALNTTVKQYGLDSPVATLGVTAEVDGKRVTQDILVGKETSQKKCYVLWKNQLLVCEVTRDLQQLLAADWLTKPSR